MLREILALTPRSRVRRETIRHHFLTLAGLVVATNVAMAQNNWIPNPGYIPFDAVAAGYQLVFRVGGGFGIPLPLYVCRGGAEEGYGIQVGNFRSDFAGCNIGYGGTEIIVPDFEFLVTSWQDASSGSVPSNAVKGGQDDGGQPLYYCRGNIAGKDLEPGKIRPGFLGCSIPYGGLEKVATTYQVLVGLSPAMPLATVSASGGSVPQDAISGGTDDDGTGLYLCSASYGSGVHPGKLKPDLKGCLVPYGGVEHLVSNYNVLVPKWVKFKPIFPPYLKFDFRAGTDVGGQPLHACRAYSGGNIYPGKMQTTWGACDFGWGGTEQWSTDFDVLSDTF